MSADVETEKPWSDVDVVEDIRTITSFAEDFGRTPEEVLDSLQKSAWLADQDLETVLEYSTDRDVSVDHDTRLEHNVYVWTGFSTTPEDITIEEGFDAYVSWLVGIRQAIKRYTGYRITNKRVIDNELVLTLAPEN